MGFGERMHWVEKKIQGLIFRQPREPLKIRQLILDEIESRIEPAGRSARIFPFNHLHIGLLATDEEHNAVLESLFVQSDVLKELILESLREAGCEPLAAIDIVVEIVEQRGSEWAENAYFHIKYAKLQQPRQTRQAQSRAKKKPASPKIQITILNGKAAKSRYSLAGATINIGRLPEICDRNHNIVRRNQVVFVDEGDEANQTVSRIHAHIRFDETTDEFRLHDDQSAQGTRIVRDGVSIDVLNGNRRGNKLQSGDEIYFGQARVRIEIKR